MPVVGERIEREPLPLGFCENLGCKLADNVFTICQQDGNDLAPGDNNFARIGMPDTTPGLIRTMVVTANATITDGNASQLDASTFGITAAANWAVDMPFYLYAINYNNTIVYFGISRDPTKTTTPATCYGYDGGANLQGDLLGFIATANVANIQSAPCVCIGSICMQWTT